MCIRSYQLFEQIKILKEIYRAIHIKKPAPPSAKTKKTIPYGELQKNSSLINHNISYT